MPYLFKAGVVRVRRAEEMGLLESKEAHDGEYPLRRYSRVVDYRIEMM